MAYYEWLLTNGLGSYSIGTSSDTIARPHQALLTAVLRPPLRRRACVRQVYDEVHFNNAWLPLVPVPGEQDNQGAAKVSQTFRLDKLMPVFTIRIGDMEIEKRLWMGRNEHALYIQYHVLKSPGLLKLRCQPALILEAAFCERVNPAALLEILDNGYAYNIESGEAKWIYVSMDKPATIHRVNNWRVTHFEDAETATRELNFVPAALESFLDAKDQLTLRIGLEQAPALTVDQQFSGLIQHQSTISAGFRGNGELPQLERTLIAADHFLIRHATQVSQGDCSILAGYPDRTDAGWVELVAIPGLLLVPGRLQAARQILAVLQKHADKGIIPNVFSEGPEEPSYDSIDASLWYFIAVYEYLQASGDTGIMEDTYPFLLKLVNTLIDGSENGVKMDPEDGLLANHEKSIARTWMNRRIGNWEPTPRFGKAVEVQALWFNALRIIGEFSQALEHESGQEKIIRLTEQVGRSMQEKFWLPGEQYLADVVHGKNCDRTFRANQVIALGLPFSPFSKEQSSAAMEHVRARLVTPFGLRSLAPNHPAYRGQPGCSAEEIAGAWHNGIVHPWLTWFYLNAALNIDWDLDEARSEFAPLFAAPNVGLLGHIAEAYTGNPPHTPLGTPACALSLATVIRCQTLFNRE